MTTQIRLVLVIDPDREDLFLLIGIADEQSVTCTVGLMAAAHRICNMSTVSYKYHFTSIVKPACLLTVP